MLKLLFSNLEWQPIPYTFIRFSSKGAFKVIRWFGLELISIRVDSLR